MSSPAQPCKHPRVSIVARQDDVEFVECQICREVFDSEEFRDMEIEEAVFSGKDDEAEDSRKGASRVRPR